MYYRICITDKPYHAVTPIIEFDADNNIIDFLNLRCTDEKWYNKIISNCEDIYISSDEYLQYIQKVLESTNTFMIQNGCIAFATRERNFILNPPKLHTDIINSNTCESNNTVVNIDTDNRDIELARMRKKEYSKQYYDRNKSIIQHQKLLDKYDHSACARDCTIREIYEAYYDSAEDYSNIYNT